MNDNNMVNVHSVALKTIIAGNFYSMQFWEVKSMQKSINRG